MKTLYSITQMNLCPTMMLEQLLTSRVVSSANYHYTMQSSQDIVGHCTFHPWPGAPEYIDPLVISGFPTTNINEECAALKALEHLDTHLHVQLRDYNYHAKEQETDKNRVLNKKKTKSSHTSDG